VTTQVISGDTVKLKCDFKSWLGEYTDPDSITLKIYDVNKTQVGATINLTAANKTDTGKYEYEYVVPDSYPQLIFEYRGVIDGNPILGRQLITVVFKE
jgi:hypothetical protein